MHSSRLGRVLAITISALLAAAIIALAWRWLVFAICWSAVVLLGVVIGFLVKRLATHSTVPLGKLTWMSMALAGISTFSVACSHVFSLADYVVDDILVHGVRISGHEALAIHDLVSIPLNSLAFIMGPVIVLVARELIYRAGRSVGWVPSSGGRSISPADPISEFAASLGVSEQDLVVRMSTWAPPGSIPPQEVVAQGALAPGVIQGGAEANGAVKNRLRPRDNPDTIETAPLQPGMPETVAAQAYEQMTPPRPPPSVPEASVEPSPAPASQSGPTPMLAAREGMAPPTPTQPSERTIEQLPLDSEGAAPPRMDERLFGAPSRPRPPKESLARSRERLRRLELLAVAPHLSPTRREVIENLVRAQAAVVKDREDYLKRIN